MSTKNQRPLSIFECPLKNWAGFCVIRMLAGLAEILQVEDLLHCSFPPLRNLAQHHAGRALPRRFRGTVLWVVA